MEGKQVEGKAIRLSGKEVAEHVYSELDDKIRALSKNDVVPMLATILVGEDPASLHYVGTKRKMCEQLGIKSVHLGLGADVEEEELLDRIEKYNSDEDVHGILVQLPLPKHIDSDRVIDSIDVFKDVDGFTSINKGNLYRGLAVHEPCTPAGIMKMLDYYNNKQEGVDFSLSGKDVVIVGRSEIVGKPLADMMTRKGVDATVTLCHSRTIDLAGKIKNADVVVAAIGVAGFIGGKDELYIGEDAIRLDEDEESRYRVQTIIDVGTNYVGGKKIPFGDVTGAVKKKRSLAYTPVPGGVGPMTIAMLMYNTVEAAELIYNCK